MTLLSLLERVDPQLMVLAVVLVLLTVTVLVLLFAGRNSDLRSRGETADGPDYYAVDQVLVDLAETNRRLERMARDNPDLSALPKRLEDLYSIEVER